MHHELLLLLSYYEKNRESDFGLIRNAGQSKISKLTREFFGYGQPTLFLFIGVARSVVVRRAFRMAPGANTLPRQSMGFAMWEPCPLVPPREAVRLGRVAALLGRSCPSRI